MRVLTVAERLGRDQNHAAPWLRVMLVELSDGQWHSLKSIITAGARLVPPGRAQRQAEAIRNKKRPRGADPLPPRVRPTSLEEQIDIGRRHLARASLMQLVRSGRLERDGDNVRLASWLIQTISTRDLGVILDRNPTSIAAWVTDDEVRSAVQAQLPEGVDALIPHPSIPGVKRIPIASIPAWEKVDAERGRVLARRRLRKRQAENGGIDPAVTAFAEALGRDPDDLTVPDDYARFAEKLIDAGLAVVPLSRVWSGPA